MTRLLRFARIAALSIAVFAAVVAGLVAFGGGDPPPPLAEINDAFGKADWSALPAQQDFAARDGTSIAYRAYPAAGERVAVLVHGSSGSGRGMHAVGLALAREGVTAYALDMRGHGASGRRGDIDYVGQLEDDVADFLALLRKRHPGARFTLIGHSSGGGFALRYAGGRYGESFDRYVMLAPFIHQDAPTARPGTGGWAKPFLPRMVGLAILDRMGIKRFQDLPVLAFAVPPGAAERTTAYSYRLQLDFRPREDWQGDVRALRRPASVIVGDRDSLFVASAYASALEPLSPRVKVRLLAGIDHIGVVLAPEALQAILMEVA